jgi:iron complex transport system ATP-binding protein
MSDTLIKIEQAGFERDGRWLVRFVNWEIKRGERWTLMGLNGSGKTTLLQLLTGYIWPTEGKINFFGCVDGYDLREMRRSISYTSCALSDMFHNDDSAYEIIAGGCFATIGLCDLLSPEQEARVEDLLNTFGLQQLRGHRYQILSQGERQRVALARALALDPKVLVLDEPCSGLDFVQREQLLYLLQMYLQQDEDLALVYITHRTEEIIPEITKAIFLKDGLVFGKGAVAEMLSDLHLSLLYGKKVRVDCSNSRYLVSAATQ